MTDTVDQITRQIVDLDRHIFGADAIDYDLYVRLASKSSWGELFIHKHNQLKGYALAHKLKGGSIVIHRLVVHPDCRGKGVGSTMMASIVEKGATHAIYCPERWLDSQEWLSRRGWYATRVEKGYYSGQDAFVFKYRPL